MKAPAILAVVLPGLAVLSACSGGGGDSTPSVTPTPTQSPSHTLNGTFVLIKHYPGEDGHLCSGGDSYSDIHAGTAVVVKDGTGAVLGTGELGRGEYDWQLVLYSGGIGSRSPSHCRFYFNVVGLPQSDFYTIEVSNRKEATYTYSYSDLEDLGWKPMVSLDASEGDFQL